LKYSGKGDNILFFSQNNKINGIDIRKCDKPILREKDYLHYSYNFTEYKVEEINDVI